MIETWQVFIGLAVVCYTFNSLLNKVIAKNRPGEFAAVALAFTISLLFLPFIGTFPAGRELWALTLLASFMYGASYMAFLMPSL